MIILNDDNFLLYAAKHYDNPQCVTSEEFASDVRRIFYIKKLCTRFKEKSEDKTRLLLNHIIVLNNLFGADATARLLYLKVAEHYDIIKPLLEYIGILPVYLKAINSDDFIINTDSIEINREIISELRKI